MVGLNEDQPGEGLLSVNAFCWEENVLVNDVQELPEHGTDVREKWQRKYTVISAVLEVIFTMWLCVFK